MTDPAAVAAAVYAAYRCAYDGEVQGCCPVIASDILGIVGGVAVAGYLRLGGNERSHWWVELDGAVLDPMGDHYLSHETFGERVEVHRDASVFESILPRYERWRIVLPDISGVRTGARGPA